MKRILTLFFLMLCAWCAVGGPLDSQLPISGPRGGGAKFPLTPPLVVTPTSVEMSSYTTNTQQLTATSPSAGVFSWSSSDDSAFSVSATGLVTRKHVSGTYSANITCLQSPVSQYFSSAQKVIPVSMSGSSSGIYSSTFRNGLILEFLPLNWHLSGSTIDTWYDSSGQGRNATQTTSNLQPIPDGNVASFSGSTWMRFPKVTGTTASPTIIFYKIKLDARYTASNLTGTLYYFGSTDYNNILGFDSNDGKIRWYSALGYFSHGYANATDSMTVGLYSSPSLNQRFIYTEKVGVFAGPAGNSSRDCNFNILAGFTNGGDTPSITTACQITALWQWNSDPGLDDFATIASIAAEFKP